MWWAIGGFGVGLCIGVTIGLVLNAPDYEEFDVLPKYWAPGNEGEKDSARTDSR